MKQVVLRGGKPVHPHVYSKRLLRVDRGVRDGDVVDIRTREGRPCGFGFFHSRSLIALRVLSHDPDVFPDESWLRERVTEADRLRRDVLHLPARTNAWRIVHGEGDGLSGLVVDKYDTAGSISLFSLGWLRRLDELRRVLAEEAGLEHSVARADPRSAAQERMELPAPAPGVSVEVEEDGVVYVVDPAGGHKTGFFLDQRDNRRFVAELARGRAVFDGMTYHGGFALAAAKGGAASVRGMDLDEAAIAAARANAKRNGLPAEFAHGDVFHALRAYAAGPEGERPEVLVVDPPKWARDRAGLGAALHRYGDLNRLALEAVRPGGVVVTCSCSGLVSATAFEEVVRRASFDTLRDVRVLSVSGAAPDHPVATPFPEGRYLKCLVVTVGPEGSGPGGGSDPRPTS